MTTDVEVLQEKRSVTSEKSVVVKDLGKSFGPVHAVRGISFEVGRGEVVALLGPNGAGKTTTVDMLSTLTRPDRGSASIAGFDVVSDPASVRRSIMLTGQQVALDDVLTGRENAVLFGRLQGLSKSQAQDRAEELLVEFDLVKAADRRVGTYSGGMRRRIDIACGLVVRPEVVFLDEPTTGLDPRSRQAIWDLVAGFKDLGISTLLTTQYLEEADALSDRIIVIDHGVIVAEGTADELKERTGGSYCEIVPRDLKDLPAAVEALGSLLPEKNRKAITANSDRIALPAPRGPSTLVDALSRLNAANIELTDIALRRPSLDDVFLSLTKDSTGAPATNGSNGSNGSRGYGLHAAVDDDDLDDDIDEGEGAAKASGAGLMANRRLLAIVAAVVIAIIAVSLYVMQRDSTPAEDEPGAPAVVPTAPVAPPPSPAPPAGSAPSASPQASVPAVPAPTTVPTVAPPTLRAEQTANVPVRTEPVTPRAIVTSSVRVMPDRAPIQSSTVAVAVPAVPVVPATPTEAVPPPPPDPFQQVLSPILSGLP